MTDEKPKKAAWIRHPSCGWRVFNDPIDIEHHQRLCPADLLRTIKALELRIKDLEKVEIPAETAVDLDAVGEWEEADLPAKEDVDPFSGAYSNVPDPYADSEDDEEDALPAVSPIR